MFIYRVESCCCFTSIICRR